MALSSATGICSICTKPGISLCSVCKAATYCCRDHQQQHWPLHVLICGKDPLGFGRFEFDPAEGMTNRFGMFRLVDTAEQSAVVEDLSSLSGKVVRTVFQIVEIDNSDQVGDVFLELAPKQPRLGEIIDAGANTLSLSKTDEKTISLKPADRRKDFWIDPQLIFRLWNHTVHMFIHEQAGLYSSVTPTFVAIMRQKYNNALIAPVSPRFRLLTPDEQRRFSSHIENEQQQPKNT